MSEYLVRAIKKLKPSAEFSIVDSDYSTIKWDVIEGTAPTKKQIDDAIELVIAEDKAETEAIAQQKAELLAKLGITEDESKLLLS